MKNAIFVGHSVSAMIGVLAAAQAPELFKALVMVGPSPSYIDEGDYKGGFSRDQIHELLESLDSNYMGWSATMAPVIMGNPERTELGEELTNSFCRTDPEIAKNFARATFLSDHRSDLARVRVPTLILQCSQDVIAPHYVGEYVHRQIPRQHPHHHASNGALSQSQCAAGDYCGDQSIFELTAFDRYGCNDFDDFFDTALCGFLIASPEGRILRVNARLLAWLGKAAVDLEGAPISDILTVAGKMYYETHLGPLLRMQGFFDEIALEPRETGERTLACYRQRHGAAQRSRHTAFRPGDGVQSDRAPPLRARFACGARGGRESQQ